MQDSVGQQYGHYRLVRRLGTGRFSEVYLGEHLTVGSQVAVKVLRTDLNDQGRHAFIAEVQALQRLIHPHIVRLLAYGIENATPFLIMDYVPGGSLRTRHPRGEKVSLSHVVSYVTQLCLTLHAVHKNHLIHQDIKPENILLGSDGAILLSDFGLALTPPSGQSLSYVNAEAVQGTLAYMAPELFRGRPHLASDQYALAVMVYEWLTGTHPFQGGIAQLCHQHLFEPVPSLSIKNPEISRAVERVVEKALAKEPEQRFADVLDFASALEFASKNSESPLLLMERSVPAPEDRARIDYLPGVLTSLWGRDQDRIAASTLLLNTSVRLLNIVGTGGVGKTRLALAVAADLREAFTNGVCFVPLATINNPDQLILTIAQALRLQTGSRSIFEIVQSFLQNKHLLLVLDNFEQLVDAAPQLTALLATCSKLKLLITSRETLRVNGEYEFPLSPLILPELTEEMDQALLSQNPAIALFVERAQASKFDFCLNEANVRTIAQICIQLDGLPLAIELAAVRIKLLPPHVLLTRLRHRMAVLTIGRRDAPARHQTLRNTIKWSYDLLTSSEKFLFRQICIFVGGSTLEAIEALVGEEGGNTFEHISSLLDKNLIQRNGQEEELRLLTLETIREFGLECLEEEGELGMVRQAHIRYYLRWAEIAGKAVFAHEQLRWIRAFVQELGNLRVVMQHVLKREDREAALRLGALLSPIWFLWGSGNQYIYMLEGKQFLEQALGSSEGIGGWARARSLSIYGGILAVLREAEQGKIYCQQGLKLFREMNDLQGVIQSLWMTFYALFVPGDLRGARHIAEEALAYSQQQPEICTEWGAAWTQGYSAFLAGYVAVWDGRYAEARDLLLQSSTLLKEAGDTLVLAWVMLLRSEAAVFEGNDDEACLLLEQGMPLYKGLGMMVLVAEAMILQGLVALHMGKVEQARVQLAGSLRLSKEVRDERRIAWSQIVLARVALREQEVREARHLLTEALNWAISKGDRSMFVLGLDGWAGVAIAQGSFEWATQIYAMAQTLRERTGAPRPIADQAEQQEQQEMLQAILGESRFRTLWGQGRKLTLEQIFTEQETTSMRNTVGELKSIVALTHRELDVLRLVAEGLSNAQIAERLVLSVFTTSSYLRTIYRKLGVSSRTAAVRFALDHHLFS